MVLQCYQQAWFYEMQVEMSVAAFYDTCFTVGCSWWMPLHEWQKEEGQKRSCFCQLVRVKVKGMLQIWCRPVAAYKGAHIQWKPVMHRVLKTNSAWLDCWSLCTELFPESKRPCTSPQFPSAQGVCSVQASIPAVSHGALLSMELWSHLSLLL